MVYLYLILLQESTVLPYKPLVMVLSVKIREIRSMAQLPHSLVTMDTGMCVSEFVLFYPFSNRRKDVVISKRAFSPLRKGGL